MKKSVKISLAATALAIGSFMLTSVDAIAQSTVRVGLKGGLNASSLFYDSQGATNKNERIGFHVGVFSQIPVGEFFAIQPELLYMTKGATATYTIIGFTAETRLSLITRNCQF